MRRGEEARQPAEALGERGLAAPNMAAGGDEAAGKGGGGPLPCWKGRWRAGSRETWTDAPALPRAAALAAAAAPRQSLAGNGGGLVSLKGLRAGGQRSRARGAASSRRPSLRFFCGMCRDLPPGRRASIAAVATR